MAHPAPIARLIEKLQKLPGIGSTTKDGGDASLSTFAIRCHAG